MNRLDQRIGGLIVRLGEWIANVGWWLARGSVQREVPKFAARVNGSGGWGDSVTSAVSVQHKSAGGGE